MSYRRLMRQLQGYEQEIPDYLQSFFQEYSADPYQASVIDELQRRSGDSLSRDMGQIASYYGNAGRMGGGLMGQALGDLTAENLQRERGDIGGLMSQDYQGHLQRMLEAAGLMGNIQQTGMAGTASGYGADQQRQATIGAANIAADASRYNTDAYRAIGMGNLGMNQDFGTWDRQYRSDMMPYEQLNMLGSGAGNLLSGFGQQRNWGTNTQPGQGTKGSNAMQGAIGGGMMGYGMGGFGGGGGGGGFGNFNPGSWYMSDIRLKDNVVRYGVDYLPGVPIATWQWKSDGTSDIGVIAQDMERYYPERVTTINGVKHVRY